MDVQGSKKFACENRGLFSLLLKTDLFPVRSSWMDWLRISTRILSPFCSQEISPILILLLLPNCLRNSAAERFHFPLTIKKNVDK